MSLCNDDGYQFPWTFDPAHWKTVVEALETTRVKNNDDLGNLLGTVARRSSSSGRRDHAKHYENLFTAISELESELEGFRFLESVLPQLQRDVVSAKESLGDCCPVLFRENGEGQVQLTHHQAYLIACLAFFGLCHPLWEQYKNKAIQAQQVRERCGHLDWGTVYGRRGGSVAVARIKCQLAYLHQISLRKTPENDTHVTFYRTVLAPHRQQQQQQGTAASSSRWTQQPSWATSEIPISRLRVHISTDDKIEDVKADAHIDFANKYLHIGQIIPSATQEEVLFSIRPECFVGLLFSEMMQDNEAIVITGARRFSNYTGYLRTFHYDGLFDKEEESPPPAIVAIDALVNNIDEDNQFNPERVVRDINKAYLGFAGVSSTVVPLTFHSISTGQWGCGAFMGDPYFKFIQQVLAAAEAGVSDLYFSAFHQSVLAKKLQVILQGLHQRKVTVGQLYQFLVSFESRQGGVYQTFLTWFGGKTKVEQFHRELMDLAGVAPY